MDGPVFAPDTPSDHRVIKNFTPCSGGRCGRRSFSVPPRHRGRLFRGGPTSSRKPWQAPGFAGLQTENDMNKLLTDEHVLPRPVERLPEYAHGKARQSLADRIVDAFGLSEPRQSPSPTRLWIRPKSASRSGSRMIPILRRSRFPAEPCLASAPAYGRAGSCRTPQSAHSPGPPSSVRHRPGDRRGGIQVPAVPEPRPLETVSRTRLNWRWISRAVIT